MQDQEIPSYNILKNPRLHLWEDVSESYCLIRLAAIRGEKIILLFDKTATKAELSYAKRYISSISNVSLQIFYVYFDSDNCLYPEDNYKEILEALSSTRFLLLKYRAQRSMMISKNALKPAKLLDKTAVSLYLPNYRERCEMTYLHYSSDSRYLAFIESILGDECSKNVLKELMRVAAENDLWKIPESESYLKYFECYKHKDDEIWVNCGSYVGDTIINFIAADYPYSKIFAIEGDSSLFAKLQYILKSVPDEHQQKIRALNYFIGQENEQNNFDTLFKFLPVSLINMDIEGYEMPVLRGASELIRKYRPVLAISAYHLVTDLYDVPSFVNNIADNYTFFLRKYSGQSGNVFNEFIYYCVPRERAY